MVCGIGYLLTAKAATGAGAAVPVPKECAIMPTGIQIYGTFVGTVVLEATVATQAEVDGSTAVWAAVAGASWTTSSVASLGLPFTHIRANVTAYTSGAINVRAN